MRVLAMCIIALLTTTSIVKAECKANFAGNFIDRYTLHSDGTVTDNATGLMWMRCDLGRNWDASSNTCLFSDVPVAKDWMSVLDDVKQNTFAGYSDWRLPNIKELASLIERHCSPQINDSVFLEPKSLYWSSTPSNFTVLSNSSIDRRYESAALAANFQDGHDIQRTALSDKAYARLVRLQ